MRTWALILLPLLVGCTTTVHNIDEPSELATVLEQKDRSVVFGRVRWIENGEEKKIGDSYFEMRLRPDLVRMEDKQRIQTSIDEGGHFCWSLKPGAYLMHRLVYWDTLWGNYILVPKVAFAVPEAGRIYYIGTLRGDFAKGRDLVGGVTGNVDYSVQNERVEETARLRKECGLTNQRVESSMMRHDHRLPKSIETTDGFLMAARLITAMGMYSVGSY